MKIKIESDAKVQVLSHSFTVSPSQNAYTLQYSADGESWTAYEEEVPESEVLIVNGIAFGQFIWLDGYVPENGSEGTLIY